MRCADIAALVVCLCHCMGRNTAVSVGLPGGSAPLTSQPGCRLQRPGKKHLGSVPLAVEPCTVLYLYIEMMPLILLMCVVPRIRPWQPPPAHDEGKIAKEINNRRTNQKRHDTYKTVGPSYLSDKTQILHLRQCFHIGLYSLFCESWKGDSRISRFSSLFQTVARFSSSCSTRYLETLLHLSVSCSTAPARNLALHPLECHSNIPPVLPDVPSASHTGHFTRLKSTKGQALIRSLPPCVPVSARQAAANPSRKQRSEIPQ
jgi:hypothetical protein